VSLTSGASQPGVRPVLMMELNELCPPIIERMMARGELPNFRALHAKSDVHVTWTDDVLLEPWVQWVTLHTGRTQEIHRATQLDEGYRIDLPRVWDVLADRGHASLVFGSMNARTKSDKVFLLPDPWSTRVAPSDPRFNAFQDFISFNVTEHTNERARASRKQTIDFIRFMLGHGLKLETVMRAARQVAVEKTVGRHLTWRRALVLDLMMWDVFEAEYRRRRPAFATFFANSTAYLQHRYWRHMEPEAYDVKPSTADIAAFGGAIDESYRHMDRLLGKAMRLVGPGGRIVFATGLSQEANLRYEHQGGKFVYRPHDFDAFNAFIGGAEGTTFEPVMTHQCWASFRTPAAADRFEACLAGLTANGAPVMWWWREDETRIFFWSKLIAKVEDGMPLRAVTGERRDFSAVFSGVGQVNNSQHNRNGCFWVERGEGLGRIHAGKLPLEQATQLLLDLFPAPTPKQAPANEQHETVAAYQAAE
jgi:hypothetical protein